MSLPFDARPVEPADAARLRSHFENAGRSAWCYFAPFLCSYHLPPGRQVLIGWWQEALWVVQATSREVPRFDLVVPPLPFSPERLEAFSAHGQPECRVLWAEEDDARAAREAGFDVREKESEYLYDPTETAALEGRPYRDLRKRIRRFEREVGGEIRSMGAGDVEACGDLLKTWRKKQGRRLPFLFDWGYTRKALEQFDAWEGEVAGQVLDTSGGLAAFALYGPLTTRVACFFVLKADPGVRGAGDYLRWAVLKSLTAYERVNDAGDLGLPGLRQQKRKFRPRDRQQVYSIGPGKKGVEA